MKKILVVDDDESIRELVSATLENDAYLIYQASNGQDALDLVRREHPELVLLDVEMPVKDGLEVCRVLKSAPETRSIHVIMLTGKADEEGKQKSLEVGADDYFTKPFSPLSLIKKIESILG